MNFDSDSASTRPYLIRALFEWCVDQGLTPYLLVVVNDRVRVPKEFIKNGEIVLNISPEATGGLQLGNEWIEFKARFGGVAREIMVPVEQVVAIYAKENAQGMAFPRPPAAGKGADSAQGKTKASAPGLSVVGARPAPEQEEHGHSPASTSTVPTVPTLPNAWSKMLGHVGLKSVPSGQASTQDPSERADSLSETASLNPSTQALAGKEKGAPSSAPAASAPSAPVDGGGGDGDGGGGGYSHLKRIK